jgi:hypothetical protein
MLSAKKNQSGRSIDFYEEVNALLANTTMTGGDMSAMLAGFC